MLIPINWLKEYIDINLTDEQISQTLTLAGLTIEEIKDGVMDGEVTANRPDWLSIYGVARELSALTSTKLKKLNVKSLEAKKPEIKIVIEDESLINRYSGYVIKNVNVADSPDWLKQKLESVNIRSINNIVDITNYIMIATGQPLHSFDLDKITGDIIIRRGKKGESITTLDRITRNIDNNTIVAENNGQLIDLVGIMGGALSDTTRQSRHVFIQAAVFPTTLIRKSSKSTKLSTEASYRYERGVDYVQNKKYLDLAAQMIVEICGGEIDQLIDINPAKESPKPIKWSLNQAESLLGVTIPAENALNWLNSLGIKTTSSDNHLTSLSPTWRFDINIKEDIIEELARFYPINKMPRTKLSSLNIKTSISRYNYHEYIKDTLVTLGFSEIDGYSFLSAKNIQDAGLNADEHLKASNPLSEEYQYLRTTLLPDMLLAVAQNPLFNPVTLFEIGNVFTLNDEKTHLGIIIAGNNKEVNHYKQHVNIWIKDFLPDTRVELRKIDQEILNKYKIRKSEVYFLEIPTEKIIKKIEDKNVGINIPKMNQKYTPVSKFPAIKRDLAVIVDKSIDPQEIIESISSQSPDNIEILSELFDEFVSDKFGPNKKSLAFHILYQSTQKTLTDNDIESIHQKIIQTLENNFQATARI